MKAIPITIGTSPRIQFLDAVRVSMVFCVVLVHSAAAYANVIPWWHVRDPRSSAFFDLLVIVLDIF